MPKERLLRTSTSIAALVAPFVVALACSNEKLPPGASGGNPGNALGGATLGGYQGNQGGANTSRTGTSQAQGGNTASQAGATAGLGGTSSSQGGARVGQGGTSPAQGGALIDQGGATSAQGGASVIQSGVGGALGGTTSSRTSSVLPSGGATSASSNLGGASASGGGVSTSGGGVFASGGAAIGGQSATGGSVVARQPAARPTGSQTDCGNWALTEGVCCAQYCSNDNKSESCDKCGGPGSAQCEVVNAKACTSGQWPEVHAVTDNEAWHYSRSTHFGLTASGACAFGLYGLCTTAYKFNSGYAEQCDAFCKAYPDLCRDPADKTLHGNFAAPQGNYFSQFWSSLPGDNDNYMSCGECFELVRTQKDGTEYKPGDSGYTPPIIIQVVDSCPCAANSKWCCGSGRDHCGEVSDFTYGCQLPPSPPPPKDHDPTSDESIHFDLSDMAMARLQTGKPDGAMVDGVVPTKYRRIPCPVPGNMYFWLQTNANEYYFSFTVVNMAGLGAPAKVEARLPSGTWVAMQRNSNYTMSRPQERYGTWVLPQNSGKFDLPVSIRITDGGGRAVIAEGAIKSWTPSDSALKELYYIDSGVQF
jgi:hypothetical protein